MLCSISKLVIKCFSLFVSYIYLIYYLEGCIVSVQEMSLFVENLIVLLASQLICGHF